jgi:hypothetical protein
VRKSSVDNQHGDDRRQQRPEQPEVATRQHAVDHDLGQDRQHELEDGGRERKSDGEEDEPQMRP